MTDPVDSAVAEKEAEMREWLKARFGESRNPKKIKKQEAPFTVTGYNEQTKEFDQEPTTKDFENESGVTDAPIRLNSAWYDLTEENGGLQPVGGVKYLWVVRDDGHLILGIEDVGQMKAAFGVDPAETVKAMQAKQGKENVPDDVLEGLGHPTLAAKFVDGAAVPAGGRIGGELSLGGGGWTINDHSGRFGKGRGDTRALLLEAAVEFGKFGIEVLCVQSKEGTADQPRLISEVEKEIDHKYAPNQT